MEQMVHQVLMEHMVLLEQMELLEQQELQELLKGGGYIHSQTSAATIWQITHSLDTRPLNVDIFDSNYNLIITEFVSFPTVDTAEITLSSDTEGYAIFSSISASYTQVLSDATLQDVTTNGNITTNNITVAGITASGLIYPDTDGTDGQVLTTDGAGNLAFESIQDVYVTVKNVAGGELAKGTPVHATSSVSAGNSTPVIAASSSLASSMPATFVLNETIADGAEGQALLSGFIQGVNTLGFTVGDVVYVGENGGFTNIKPQSSDNLIQNLGIVTKIHETNGGGWIYGSGRSNDVPNLPTGKIWVGSDTYSITSSFIHVSESNSSLIVGENNHVDHVGQSNKSNSAIIGGTENYVRTPYSEDSIIVGGAHNTIYNSSDAFIGSGRCNCINASNSSIILGGSENTSSVGGANSILGGYRNKIQTNYGFIGNGICNTIAGSSNAYNAIISGENNTITSSLSSTLRHNFIGGGKDNLISGSCSSILGGHDNIINHNNSFIIGSNLTSTADCTTFMNNLVVEGTGSFGTLHTIYETSSIIYSSGSTKFGDTLDDTHIFTGSVDITGSFELTGSLNISGSLVVDGPISSTVFETSYSSDTEAAAAGVPVYGLYRNGNFLFVRLS